MDPMRERAILKLLSDDPACILLLRNKCTTDNMWKVAIQLEPSLFQYMNNPSNEMCLFALKEDGNNLQYVVKNPDVKLTPEMLYTAVKSYPAAIFDVPIEMRDNAIKEFAFDQDPTLIKNFVNIRKEYIQRKIKNDPSFIRFLNDPDEDLICKAIENDPNYCVYVKKFTPRIKKLIETLYPDIIPLIPGFNERS